MKYQEKNLNYNIPDMLKILNFFKKKPIRKTYKFLVRFSDKKLNNKIGFGTTASEIFYGKSKGEVVQSIKNNDNYKGCRISSIILSK